ncbi:MAG: LptE family protein [Candidatus Omnitrophota bacterium]|nr:hypothetical protein [Candidatus Omnitrophota bacterium]MBU1928446.1 hypothetical protein [Candidatus Omnitrophota bacterium]MBU2034411.1 hypothetical protein [Candidatus Omnitrophota bacterium]MBU2222191.1 hypothetical protein [Candidatus Omnitrophota bacterium]MBU2258763.1 hypothetical protein [Candidatus Omnitrophota bacterium]
MMARLSRLIKITPVFVLVFMVGGCGYTTRSMVSSKYKTIYITQFANKIDITREADAGNKYKLYKPMLETDITRSVINKFLLDGNLKPIKSENADLVLKGELVGFSRDPIMYSSDNTENVEEYRIYIRVDMSLWDKKTDTLIWEEKGFTGDFTYYTNFAIGNVTPKYSTNDEPVSAAVSDLARRIVERAVEQWSW